MDVPPSEIRINIYTCPFVESSTQTEGVAIEYSEKNEDNGLINNSVVSKKKVSVKLQIGPLLDSSTQTDNPFENLRVKILTNACVATGSQTDKVPKYLRPLARNKRIMTDSFHYNKMEELMGQLADTEYELESGCHWCNILKYIRLKKKSYKIHNKIIEYCYTFKPQWI